ncbi:hypothetical protein QFC21_004855 [Naganishia friedmannii]|uniref:Uncharacterized protein n=1 Tax=Naganishia friedmannii TaxID=89922 RepID=A0ACC2VE96_9TREE|nr:hypothetical protein QFC21_004855 [Naganishia friedmannii]
MADVAKPTAMPAHDPTSSEKLRARQQEAIKRQQQIEERKNADAMEEYRLRFAAAKKEVNTLPSGKKIAEDVEKMRKDTDEIADEIEFIEPDQEHGERMRDALDAVVKNYKNGLARFLALPYLENEEMLMTCVGELMECKSECREILEDLDQVLELVYMKQPIHVWYQGLKKDCDQLYHMRTTRDLLFRTWLRGFVDRDESKDKEGGLQKLILDAFESQGVEMPDDYRIKSKEEKEAEMAEQLERLEKRAKAAEEAEAERAKEKKAKEEQAKEGGDAKEEQAASQTDKKESVKNPSAKEKVVEGGDGEDTEMKTDEKK